MVSVDVGIFDLDQLNDHVSSRSQTFVEHLLHHITDLILKSLESVDFIELNATYDIS